MTTILPAGTLQDLETQISVIDGLLDNIQQVSANSPNHIVVTANMENATWNTVATHEILTITGAVRLQVWAVCTEGMTSAGGAGASEIRFGSETSTQLLGYTNDADWSANTFVVFSNGSGGGSVFDLQLTPTVIKEILLYNEDFGYEIANYALTDGTIEFHCVWWPMRTSATVVAGAGGTL